MSSGIAITSAISSGIFSSRRATSGADALASSNPLVAAMNWDIAGGQLLKVADGVSSMAAESETLLAADIKTAEESIKALSKSDKLVNGIGKVLKFTANNINPIICATGGIKVLTAKDKDDALIDEGCALGTMFGAEKAHKVLFGTSKIKNIEPSKVEVTSDGVYELVNGEKKLIANDGEYKLLKDNRIAIEKKGLYKNNPFAAKQVEAFKDCCEATKICNKSLKFMPNTLKALSFVGFSIAGYKIGAKIGNTINEQRA